MEKNFAASGQSHSGGTWGEIDQAFRSSAGARFALITLVEKQGSSYLQPGARLLVRDDGAFWGEISAGCLEAQVAEAAVRCIHADEHQILKIDTRPLYGCFGEVTLLIEVLDDVSAFEVLLDKICEAKRNRTKLFLSTDYQDLSNPEPLTQRSTTPVGGDSILIEKIVPPIQLFVFGDWPDGKKSSELAKFLGWESSIFDASAPGFSAATIIESNRFDHHSAILIATHNLGRDLAILEQFLRTSCGYIGVIGSRKRRAELERLIADYEDFSLIEDFNRVYCPAGLDLGGDGAQAIALSVIAEIKSKFARREAGPLSDRKAPIHQERTAF